MGSEILCDLTHVASARGTCNDLPVRRQVRRRLLRWNGQSWADAVPAPHGRVGATALSADSVWAGSSTGEGTEYLQHWDGLKWSSYPVQPTDGQPRQYRSVALHWDGTSWTRVPTPDGQHAVSGVTPDGAGDVWMVQDAPEIAPMFAKKELLHHTGGTWTPVPVADTPDGRGVEEVTLANIPGTTSMWGAATLTYPYSYDWRGAVLRHD